MQRLQLLGVDLDIFSKHLWQLTLRWTLLIPPSDRKMIDGPKIHLLDHLLSQRSFSSLCRLDCRESRLEHFQRCLTDLNHKHQICFPIAGTILHLTRLHIFIQRVNSITCSTVQVILNVHRGQPCVFGRQSSYVFPWLMFENLNSLAIFRLSDQL